MGVWPSGQGEGFLTPRSRVRIPPRPFSGERQRAVKTARSSNHGRRAKRVSHRVRTPPRPLRNVRSRIAHTMEGMHKHPYSLCSARPSSQQSDVFTDAAGSRALSQHDTQLIVELADRTVRRSACPAVGDGISAPTLSERPGQTSAGGVSHYRFDGECDGHSVVGGDVTEVHHPPCGADWPGR